MGAGRYHRSEGEWRGERLRWKWDLVIRALVSWGKEIKVGGSAICDVGKFREISCLRWIILGGSAEVG